VNRKARADKISSRLHHPLRSWTSRHRECGSPSLAIFFAFNTFAPGASEDGIMTHDVN
jgi:hypothetical protein